MTWLICENCKTARRPREAHGWVVAGRYRPQESYGLAALFAQPEPPPSTKEPLDEGVTFCGVECMTAWLNAGQRSVMAALGGEG